MFRQNLGIAKLQDFRKIQTQTAVKMLYLEDYLEMIENLPMEMRDRLTEMREMDLQVQNSMDSLEDRVKKFFEKCRTIPSLKQDWKDDHFKKIKEDYHKALEDEDEKVQLTAQIYDLLERYLRKLDMELQKFKLELEADNAGITEVLEKRSLELDNPQNNSENHRGEKRKSTLMMGNGTEKRRAENPDKLLSSLASEPAPRESGASHSSRERGGGGGGAGSTASSPAITMLSSSASTPALSYSLGTVGAGSNAAIAAAASRAIAATSEMPQGRRSASMKASYEAMLNSDADLASSLGLSRQFSSGSRAGGGGGSEATTPQPTSHKSRNKKSAAARLQQQQQAQSGTMSSQGPSSSGVPVNQSQLAQQLQQPVVETPPPAPPPPTEVATETTVVDEGSNPNWQVDPIDPNEPRYCICNEVSYGDMVGCDNEDCPIEWFHYGCVGLTQAPRGKWYCPQCTVAMKRRGRR